MISYGELLFWPPWAQVLSKCNHLMLTINASINIFIYVIKVRGSNASLIKLFFVIFYFKRIPSSEQPWKQCCVLSFAGTWHRDCVIVSLSQELKRWSVQAWWYISLSSLSALPHLSLLVFTFNSFILRAYFIHYPILWWKLANNQLPSEKIFHICWINCLLLLILWKSMTVVRIV